MATSGIMPKATQKILVVGLGNIDRPNSRHSIGMKVLDRLADLFKIGMIKQRHYQAVTGFKTLTVIAGEHPIHLDMHLLKSVLPMNANGRSVRKAAELLSINCSNIYLLHDELDKAAGKHGMKESGSARFITISLLDVWVFCSSSGHNGVRSVFECLSSNDIARLRIGIDRPTSQNNVINYVLEDFTAHETTIMEHTMDKALATLLTHVEGRLKLNRFELARLVGLDEILPNKGFKKRPEKLGFAREMTETVGDVERLEGTINNPSSKSRIDRGQSGLAFGRRSECVKVEDGYCKDEDNLTDRNVKYTGSVSRDSSPER